MTQQPTVFIICGVHNDLVHTKRLLACIRKQSYSSRKTIIVDDCSADGTEDYIRSYHPGVTLLKGNGNLWWTGALFWGVEEALKVAKENDFFLTINNDCTFGRDFVSVLTKTSIEYKRAIVGSLVIDNKDRTKIWDAGVQIDWSRGKFIPLGPKTIKELPTDQEIQDQIDTLSTKGTLYPIEVFHKIGNFDKKHLPHYVSDYEFACRAKKKDFKLLLCYRVRLYNDVERTGIGEKVNLKKLNFRQICNLMFSRSSRLNIVDHFWFITLCCPPRYKVKNYVLLFLKFIYSLSLVPPFVIFRPSALWIRDRFLKDIWSLKR